MPQKQLFEIKFDDIKFEKELQKMSINFDRLVKESTKDAKEILISQARLFCIDLVHVTQPWGKGKKAQKTGQGAVGRDINKVYYTESHVYDRIKEDSVNLAKKFYHLIKVGNFSEADVIARIFNLRAVEFDGGKAHQMRQTGRRKVIGSQNTFGLKKDVDAYAKEIKKRVGFAKAGWVDAAKALKSSGSGVDALLQKNASVKKIPAWIRNQAGGLGDARISSNQKGKIEITLINKVDYIGKLVDKYHIKKAAASRGRAIGRLVKKVIEINGKKIIK